jgi:hypothetical protein
VNVGYVKIVNMPRIVRPQEPKKNDGGNMLDEEDIKKLLHERGIFELWLDKHNHFMSFIRTIGSVVGFVILWKVW